MQTTHPRTDEAFARELDAHDSLRGFRDEFLIPPAPGTAGVPSVYLTGNSLGAQPRSVATLLNRELEDWARLGVEAHTHGRNPWLPYHEQFRAGLARLVGAHEHEVVAMNSLTVNLHLLMASFYRPTRDRFKILIEDSAFPSDSYAVASQAAVSGFDPARAIIRVKPRSGEHVLRTSDVCDAIARESPALVLLGAVNYLTGQWSDMPEITAAGHAAGSRVGWDLAHAIGNVPLSLQECDADFAAWCSYKYLNAGPGAVAGAFIHERHVRSAEIPRLAGWWGTDPATRFRMDATFAPAPTADAWSLSNPPILSLAPLKASLELFDRASMARLRDKSMKLTGYLEDLLRDLHAHREGAGRSGIEILTPSDPARRGCQLSIVVPGASRTIQTKLLERGVLCDFREPNVIRAAPVPLYNSFHDVWRFTEAFAALLP